ncbi:MAG: VWA domain-containing protein [Acidobacteria bacterium]|nr:VWA domain-containing protein [Acidobacteriota bacterium]
MRKFDIRALFLSAAITLFLVAGQNVLGQKLPAEAASNPPLAASLSVGLVVDNSGSYRTIFERVITSTNAVIADARPGDEGFLVTFVDTPKIVLRQEMTSNKQELQDSAENMFVEGGPTAILDAVMFSAKYMAEQSKAEPDRSRVLILITDGDERESAASLDEVVKALKFANIRLFVLGLYEEKIYTKVIDRLCKDSGGAKFVPKTPKETTAAISSLLSAIRTK